MLYTVEKEANSIQRLSYIYNTVQRSYGLAGESHTIFFLPSTLYKGKTDDNYIFSTIFLHILT